MSNVLLIFLYFIFINELFYDICIKKELLIYTTVLFFVYFVSKTTP